MLLCSRLCGALREGKMFYGRWVISSREMGGFGVGRE